MVNVGAGGWYRGVTEDVVNNNNDVDDIHEPVIVCIPRRFTHRLGFRREAKDKSEEKESSQVGGDFCNHGLCIFYLEPIGVAFLKEGSKHILCHSRPELSTCNLAGFAGG
tara:strand:- start:966 stop:1295 length:330 start_codon:yes stop_codon:yes gene_type:complete